jgi:hypothetical protein
VPQIELTPDAAGGCKENARHPCRAAGPSPTGGVTTLGVPPEPPHANIQTPNRDGASLRDSWIMFGSTEDPFFRVYGCFERDYSLIRYNPDPL